MLKNSDPGTNDFLNTIRENNLKLFAFTIDLESEYVGLIDRTQNEIFNDLDKIDEVLSILTSLDVKITVFVMGKLFDLFPEVIKLMDDYQCEFEAHSYSHDYKNPDSEFEIVKAKEAYFNYFNKYPKGYRAPRGKISKRGIKHLEKHGFLYDSSIFPSYFPNPFRYLFSNKDIHYFNGSGTMEIPFTSITPLRLTLSISYIKLFGVDFYIKLSNMFPLSPVICFDSHLHDFIHVDSSFNKLPLYWRIPYGRNKLKGTEYCVKYIKYMKQMGYQFCFMSELYELGKKVLSSFHG
jgi:hypothetical protein